MRKKKLLSTMLAFSLAMSMIPATMAYNGEGDMNELPTIISETDAQDTETVTSDTFPSVVDGKITLETNKTYEITTSITINNNTILDLNGGTIKYTGTDYAITVSSGKHLTIVDSSGSGKIEKNGWGTVIQNNGGTLTIGEEDGTNSFTLTGSVTGKQELSVLKTEPNSTTTIYGGTFDGTDRSIQNYGTMTIYGGTFKGKVQSWTSKGNTTQGKITVNGGTFESWISASVSNDTANNPYPGEVIINGGTFKSWVFVGGSEVNNSGWEFKNEYKDKMYITINGGDFTQNTLGEENGRVISAVNVNNVKISGGKFSGDVTKWVSTGSYLAENYGVQTNGDGTYTVKEIAKIKPVLTATTDSSNEYAGYTVNISGLTAKREITVQVDFGEKYALFYLTTDSEGKATFNATEGAKITVVNGKLTKKSQLKTDKTWESPLGFATITAGK